MELKQSKSKNDFPKKYSDDRSDSDSSRCNKEYNISNSRIGAKNEELEICKSPDLQPNHLQVVRRRNKSRRRCDERRRNTIDVNFYDMQKAKDYHSVENKLNTNASKSTNYLDKIDVFPPISSCHGVRRRSRIVIDSTSSDEEKSASNKAKGPEFILNSSLPPQNIDISDKKVCISSSLICFCHIHSLNLFVLYCSLILDVQSLCLCSTVAA